VPQYVKEKYGQKYLDRLLAKSNFHVGHNTLYSDYRNKFIRNPKLADDPMYEYNHMPFDHFKYGRSNNRFSDRKNAKKANTNIKLSEHKLMRKMNDNFQIVSNLEPYASEIDITENPLVKIENDWQDYEMIPLLANNLDIVTKYHGIFQTEELTKVNHELRHYFSRMPQYT